MNQVTCVNLAIVHGAPPDFYQFSIYLSCFVKNLQETPSVLVIRIMAAVCPFNQAMRFWCDVVSRTSTASCARTCETWRPGGGCGFGASETPTGCVTMFKEKPAMKTPWRGDTKMELATVLVGHDLLFVEACCDHSQPFLLIWLDMMIQAINVHINLLATALGDWGWS